MNWDQKLKEILAKNWRGNCPNPSCNREIDRGDIAWNSGSTMYGTEYSVVEIQCQSCDTEVVMVRSWYSEIEGMEDLCHVLALELEPHLRRCPSPECDYPSPEMIRPITQKWYVECARCAMRGPKSVDEDNAIRLWNTLPRHLATQINETKEVPLLSQG